MYTNGLGNVNSGVFRPRPVVAVVNPVPQPTNPKFRSAGRKGFRYGSSADNPVKWQGERAYLSGLGDDTDDSTDDTSSTSDTTPWYQSLLTDATSIGKAVVGISAVEQLNTMNLARAKQGLPPLSSLPTATVQASVSPQIASYMQYGLWIAAGLAGIFLLKTVMKK